MMNDKAARAKIHTDPDAILSLLSELETRAHASSQKVMDNARMTERLASGSESASTNHIWGATQDIPEVPQDKLDQLIMAWAAIITRTRPSVYATTSNPTVDNVVAKDIATAVIEYFEMKEDISEKWQRTALYAATHGTGFMRIAYDVSKKSVFWEPLSVFDVLIDNASDPDDVEWCIIRTMISQYKAAGMLEDADPTYQGLPAEVSYDDAMGQKQWGVPKLEIWYPPGRRFPNGLFANIIDGRVTEAMEYPYTFDNGEGEPPKSFLPVVYWTCRNNRGSTLGRSWGFKCAPLQAALNDLNSKLLQTAMLSQAVLALPKALNSPDFWDQGNMTLTFDTAQREDMQYVKWLNTCPIDPQQVSQAQDLLVKMNDCAGLNESTLGDSAASQSGTAIAYNASLDTNKHSESIKSLQTAIRNAWELTFKLVQKYYVGEIKLPATKNRDARSFYAADIVGTEINIEPRSANDGTTQSKINQTKDEIAQGFRGPEALAELQPSLSVATSRKLVNTLIDRFINNVPFRLTPNFAPPEVVAEVIDDRLSEAALDDSKESEELIEVILSFKEQYEAMMAQSNAPLPEEDPDAAGSSATPEGDALAPLPEQVSDELTGLPGIPGEGAL